MLGRFVYALNQYCKDVHAMDYSVDDYWVYEFAKVRLCRVFLAQRAAASALQSCGMCSRTQLLPSSL